MARGRGGTQDESAKHMFDRIGQQVYEQVKTEAEQRSNGDLEACVSFASILGETAGTTDPCELQSEYTKLISGSGITARGDPCGNRTGKEDDLKRFSKERVSKYDEKKIGCSNSEGACAPFRRLHLCNKNFPNMNSKDSSKAKNDLLVDVCLAAKYEGESLKGYHEQYEVQYPSSGSTMCTELARSFADIGDIIRGRDLYLGKKKKKQNETKTETERDQLESKLKEIFKEIHSGLSNGAEARYKGDEANNFYQLREDWWTANRETVWKAITCKAEGAYFRATCSMNGSGAQAKDNCRCKDEKGKNTDQVPTYFDYVPQYLRWFEEWAEDFCRKKKKKLPNVKNKCRGKYQGEERYCSLNGCDCTKTVRARGKLRYGNRCIDCLYACNPYVHWIDKKKEEFDKQKNKYEKEMQNTFKSYDRITICLLFNIVLLPKLFFYCIPFGFFFFNPAFITFTFIITFIFFTCVVILFF